MTLFNVHMRSAIQLFSHVYTSRLRGNAMGQCTCACVMAEHRCSAHADVEQSDGDTLSAKKPRNPLSSYII